MFPEFKTEGYVNVGFNTGGVARCTVTDPVGPFPGTVRIDGNPLPCAPKWQANFTLRYSVPLANGEFCAALCP